jgi:hypothetical protein
VTAPTPRSDSGWLVYDAEVRMGSHSGPEALLEGVAALPGGVKLAWNPSVGLRVRAEQRAADDAPTQQRDVRSGFTAARRLLAARPSGRCRAAAPASATALVDACREAGWAVAAEGREAVAIPLPTGDALAPVAELACDPRGGPSLRVGLGALPDDPAAARAAALLMLSVAAAYRGVRALLTGGELALEACIPPEPTAAQVDTALAALYVAVAGCAAELRLLADDPDLARCFVASCESVLPRPWRVESENQAKSRYPSENHNESQRKEPCDE